ncbi:Transposon TX1 uncharacterized 149 kDa protein [Trametes pubescens]|uniref:Transposon TX1 uncharacterized 149 kDa protein n=1 Tax=Trametes pubescens TaxID=154538 RepID=A0A1M2VSL3_TRAPU|nr:Transposon TX1 uncharacterized 149 kDa protein [Trametes pubescens]
MDPWAAREMAAREMPVRDRAAPANPADASTPLDPPGYRPRGPIRSRGPHENQGLANRTEERTRDPRLNQGAAASRSVAYIDENAHPQRMDVDGPQYEASDSGGREFWDNYAEGAGERTGSWGDYAQDDGQSEEDEEMTTHAMSERPPRTEVQYMRAMEGLGIMARPADGFPEVHFQSTLELTRHISAQNLAEWRKRSPPECRLLLIVFGEEGLNRAAAARLSSRMETIFEEFLGHSRFRLDPPLLLEHENALKQDPALVWRLSNIEPLAKSLLVRQFGWSNGQTSFHAFGEEYPVPKLVTGLDGFTQKSGVDRDIRDAFLDGPFLATIENLVRKKNRSAIRVREIATAAVNALRVEIRHSIKDDEESPFTAYVYINIPGVDPKAWEEWKKNEVELLTEYFGADGRITLHRGDRCRGCHGMDHTWTHCRYGKDDLRGWNTRAADRNNHQASKTTVQQQPKRAQTNWWDEDRGGRDGRRNDDRRARGQSDNRDEYRYREASEIHLYLLDEKARELTDHENAGLSCPVTSAQTGKMSSEGGPPRPKYTDLRGQESRGENTEQRRPIQVPTCRAERLKPADVACGWGVCGDCDSAESTAGDGILALTVCLGCNTQDTRATTERNNIDNTTTRDNTTGPGYMRPDEAGGMAGPNANREPRESSDGIGGTGGAARHCNPRMGGQRDDRERDSLDAGNRTDRRPGSGRGEDEVNMGVGASEACANEDGRAPRSARRKRPREERLTQKSSVRVATLNVNGFGSLVRDHPDNKWGKMYRMMSEQRIGVLLLQETHLTEDRIAQLHRMFAGRIKIYASAHPTAPTQREGVAIVLNKKLISTKNVTTREIVRGRAMQISIPWRGGDVRHILCIYAPTTAGTQERREFFLKAAEYYANNPTCPRPHVMAGDFNNVEDALDRFPAPEEPRDGSVAALDELKVAVGLMRVDGWRTTNPTEKNYTFQRGTGGDVSMSRLDRIYIRPSEARWAREWTITPVGVKTDHSLVSVMLTTPSTPEVGKGRPVFPLFLLRDKKLKAKMKTRGMQAVQELEQLDRLGRTDARNAQKILSEMKRDWLAEARKREKEMTPRLLKEIEERERRLSELARLPTPLEREHAEEMASLTLQLRSMKEKRHKQQQTAMRAKHRTLGESPTKYWTRLHRTHAPRELIPAFEREGECTREGEKVYESNTARMAEMARAHHDAIQLDGPDVTPPEQREHDIKVSLESIDARLSDDQVEDMGAAISWGDCEHALKFAKTGTAPGLDGIQYEVWKTMHARFVEDSKRERGAFNVLAVLHRAFQDISEHGVVNSTDFAQGWMSPIYKEKGELTKVVNYRPITLLNTDYKLLTKVLAVRLAAVAQDIVHPAQAGFVPGRRLHNHTQLARMMMEWAEVSEENGAIVALDQEKAYDKISHDYLWRVLDRFGIPESFTGIIKALYGSAVTSVVINGVTSKTYRIYRGVRQGDPLSCLLFDLAIEPLSAMIRKSAIRGFNIPNSAVALKATLFADDTTVYLAESDDFTALQCVLDTWCSAAKAKFNIKKTEIIPIGAQEYRKEMAETYRTTGEWRNYPKGVHVAADGAPVRVLGAFMGNKVLQCEVWSAKLEKVDRALDKWRTGNMTLVGKKHAVQMVIGGMTQFLTNVQRMPEQVVKRFVKMARDFVWDEKHYIPVAMDQLYLPQEQGGIALLDMNTRNEAIDVMWLKAYLAIGTERPLWALVADDLFARATPIDAHPREMELRVNPFLQNWSPRTRSLGPELKALVQTAKKFGLRQEGLAFSKEILRRMPIWDHAQGDRTTGRSLASRSAATACLKKNHKVRTVGDCEKIAAVIRDSTHRDARDCTCRQCEACVVRDGCSNPHRCYTRASQLMATLPPKWDPRGAHPEDLERLDGEEGEGDGTATPFDRRVTTHGLIADTFRIFTDRGTPTYNGRLDGMSVENGTEVTVATDGACLGNGNKDAAAGAAVFVGEGHPSNIAIRLPDSMDSTNQTGEMVASLLATRGADPQTKLTQETDSKTVMQAVTTRRQRNEDTGFIEQKNAELTKVMLAALRARQAPTLFRWVKGHDGHPGNEGADRLAGMAARKPTCDDVDLTIPLPLRLSGAKLTAMTQRLAYRAIRCEKSARLPSRRATQDMLEVITRDLERATGVAVKEETLWTSLGKPDVTRECRQFMWKVIHDAFMVGRHWLRPKMADELQARATCKICNELESMDHILFKCRAVGRERIWDLLKSAWRRTGREERVPAWGLILGAACVPTREGGGAIRDAPSNALWTVLATESAYLVWKLRCERVIQNDGKEFTTPEISNRWYSAINGRLTLDRSATAKSLGDRALKSQRVQAVWRPILEGAGSLPFDWVGRSEVLVGIRRLDG